MGVPQYIQRLVDSGEASIGVSNFDKEASFIGHPFEIERRGIANTKLEASALGYPVFIDQKGARVLVKAEPMSGTGGLSAVVKGKNIDTLGRDSLARHSRNPLRKANARLVEPSNMDELEDNAARLYGRISQALRDDSHHIVGINSGARQINSLEPRRREPTKKRAQHNGLYTGDHPRNLSAIPGDRAIGRPNAHQSIIHTAEDPRSVAALYKHYGLPNAAHPTVDLVGPVQAARQNNTQREAAALASFAIERLSVQLAMLDPRSSGAAKAIQQSKDLIHQALLNTREMGDISSQQLENINRLAQMLRRH